MNFRRFAILIFIVVIGAVAAFGQVAPQTLPAATTGVAYNQGLSVSGFPLGAAPTWTISSGSLPPGLALSSPALNKTTATIAGTPTTGGTYSFTVTATNPGSPNPISQAYTVVVSGSGGALTMANPAAVSGLVGQTVSMQFTASGGSSPYTYSLQSGTIPPGLSLGASTGLVTGQATTANTYTFTILVTDSASNQATATGTITINPSASTVTMPNPAAVTGIIGQTVTMQFTASGGTTPYTYTLQTGTLPPGLSLNASSGTVTGIATQVGAYTFTIQVADTANTKASATGTITINTATTTLTMANPTAITGAVGQVVGLQFAASGGVSPYAYTLSSGTVPPGLNLNAQTGAVVGTATQVGTYTFTIQVVDSASSKTTATGTITITTPLTVANPTAVSGNVGQTISPQWMQFAAAGGTAPYSYAVVAGSIPTGLTLNPSNGSITGQATQQGNFTFIVQATDSSTPAITATATGSISITLLTITGSISLTSSTGAAITPGGTIPAGTQPTVTINLTNAPPEAITGTLSVAYSRSLDGQGSREVLFSIGGVAPQFTIAAGTTQATFQGGAVGLIVGTAAGLGQVSVNFQDALGNNLPSPTVLPFTFSVAGTPPVIRTFTLTCSGTTYTASIIGFSSTLDMVNAVFTFTPTSGTNLAATTVTVPAASFFSAWFGTSQSNQYGGQFMLTVPFGFSVSAGSSTNPIAAATVTLTNSKGTSQVSAPASPNPACQ